MTQLLSRPDPSEYHPFYSTYVDVVPDGEILELLESQIHELETVLADVTDDEASQLHAPYTWSLKQVVGHLIDAEKIFGCRAHRFGCCDLQPLPGMDQNQYVDAMDFANVPLESLVTEWVYTRRSNLSFLRRLDVAAFDRSGLADGNSVTVRALAYIMAGHIVHHLRIVQRRIA